MLVCEWLLKLQLQYLRLFERCPGSTSKTCSVLELNSFNIPLPFSVALVRGSFKGLNWVDFCVGLSLALAYVSVCMYCLENNRFLSIYLLSAGANWARVPLPPSSESLNVTQTGRAVALCKTDTLKPFEHMNRFFHRSLKSPSSQKSTKQPFVLLFFCSLLLQCSIHGRIQTIPNQYDYRTGSWMNGRLGVLHDWSEWDTAGRTVVIHKIQVCSGCIFFFTTPRLRTLPFLRLPSKEVVYSDVLCCYFFKEVVFLRFNHVPRIPSRIPYWRMCRLCWLRMKL